MAKNKESKFIKELCTALLALFDALVNWLLRRGRGGGLDLRAMATTAVRIRFFMWWASLCLFVSSCCAWMPLVTVHLTPDICTECIFLPPTAPQKMLSMITLSPPCTPPWVSLVCQGLRSSDPKYPPCRSPHPINHRPPLLSG